MKQYLVKRKATLTQEARFEANSESEAREKASNPELDFVPVDESVSDFEILEVREVESI